MSKHTPGPWLLAGQWDARRIDFSYTDPAGNRHAGNIGLVDGMRGEQNEANARLIAAAPELLETLKALRAWHQCEYQSNPAVDARVDAVIAKAEGL